MSQATENIKASVQRTVEGMGYEFVDMEFLPRALIRVTIDCPQGVSTDDCEKVSNQLTYLFTAEDFDYSRLEVSSPGVERPLKRAADWQRFTGRLAHVELFNPLTAEGFPEAGRRKLDGRIQGVESVGGVDTVKFLFTDEKPPRTPAEEARLRKGKKAPQPAPAVEVSFPVSEVMRAWLVAQLNFKGQ